MSLKSNMTSLSDREHSVTQLEYNSRLVVHIPSPSSALSNGKSNDEVDSDPTTERDNSRLVINIPNPSSTLSHDEPSEESDRDSATDSDNSRLVINIPNPSSALSNDELNDKADRTSSNHKGHKKDSNENQEVKIPIDVQAKMALLEKRVVRCCGTTTFLYDDEFGCFEEQTEASLYVAIRKCIPPELDMKLGKHKMAEVVHRLVSSPELQVSYTEFDSHTHLINLRNAVFNVNQRRCYPHSPKYLFTSYVDADYGDSSSGIRIYRSNRNGDERGNCFIRFLEDCTDGDRLKMKSLQQLTGYIISNEWRAKKFFVLVGLPHTGKSVWLSLWRSLIGSRHTTAMSLKQLSETRFMTAELFKSKLNLSSEMDENGAIKGTDIIKAFTGGDLITAEKKGKDPFQFYGKTKLVACGNHMPLLSKLDGTTAFTDRIHFLMFSNTIPEERRDKALLDKLIAEKTYIVEWALEGLHELMDNNLIFTESNEALAFKSRYITELNNVTEFVRDRCRVDPDNDECKVHRKVLFPAYKQYCRDNGYKSLSRQEFFVEVSKHNVKPGKMRISGSTPLEGFRGIRLLTNAELKSSY
ncbi:phage/plasmid primase, P4 family [Paenibacillus glucanolyticus]|uniref:DNA primase family protein n=1 Tax=Paenibacillus glucanolyticus TaxID=59843 RepID=UPI0030C9F6F0